MATKKTTNKKVAVESYHHESATRKNIPTAKIAAEGVVPRVEQAKYAYSAHLSPELRFDASGQSDRLTDIVEKLTAGSKLSTEEKGILRCLAANASQPWLEWSGKKEEHDRRHLEVEPVALHIHERVSANAIIRAARREDVQVDLFADPQQEYKDAIQFYNHDVDWANRLILGDSLEVMSSLSKREDLLGKVQMIYIDPPYGIKFASNFQSEVGSRDVTDREADLSREPEMVKAYRDTWRLGVHTYLSYLRDRLILCRELLSDSGSIFLQISDENLHRARQVMDDVFGEDCFIVTFPVKKKGSQKSSMIDPVNDYLIWYGKSPRSSGLVKYNRLYSPRPLSKEEMSGFRLVRLESGAICKIEQLKKPDGSPGDYKDFPHRIREDYPGAQICRADPLTSGGERKNQSKPFTFEGKTFEPGRGKCWKTRVVPEEGQLSGMERLARSGKLIAGPSTFYYLRYFDDFGYTAMSNWWDGLGGASNPIYVVQTNEEIVKRCILMTTDPGDMVLDPTCGSGTTAFVAEAWGRRWVTIDSSRVALAIARQRLMTAKYDKYRVEGEASPGSNSAVTSIDPSAGFVYQKAPHITLGAIARNKLLDDVFEEYEPVLRAKLTEINAQLENVDREGKDALLGMFCEKIRENGYAQITDDDVRQFILPGLPSEKLRAALSTIPKVTKKNIADCISAAPAGEAFRDWEVPFTSNSLWPDRLCSAVASYRKSFSEMQSSARSVIEDDVDHERLVDEPEKESGVIRVSGPFTIEGVRPEELSLDENGELFDPTPNEWESTDSQQGYSENASAYLDRMLQLLGQDGVTFPNNEFRKFQRIERLDVSDSALCAEALWEEADDGDEPNVAIAFGPQHGPVTASQVEDLIRSSRRYDELVIAAFSFDSSSQAVIQESANPRLKIHMAHVRPDVSPGMDGLLKDSPKSQLFTVFGQPDISVHADGKDYWVELLGVDIYSPLTGEIASSGADKVAAWFLDSDYDGRCFCITQAFFPNQKAWDKIAKALGSAADTEAFEPYNGKASVPFKQGNHKRIAVKVIDPRGNEVMAIRSLKDVS